MATRRCYSSAHLKLVRVLADNFRQLVSRSTIGTLSELGILKYRGCRAGRAKDPIRRHLLQSPLKVNVVPHTSLLPVCSSPALSALPLQPQVGPLSAYALSMKEFVHDRSLTIHQAAALSLPQTGIVTSSPTACSPPTLSRQSSVPSLNSSWCPPSFSGSFELSVTGDDVQRIPVITTRRVATRRCDRAFMSMSRGTDTIVNCARRWAGRQSPDNSSAGRAAIRRRTRAALTALRPPAIRAIPCHKILTNSHGSDALSFIVVNAHSIAKSHALSTLATDAVSTRADVICLTETWLKVKHAQSAFDLDGYACFRLDRKRRRGGGVAVYIKYDLSPVCLNTATGLSISDNHEFLWVRMKSRGELHYLVCVCYHPPNPIYNTNDFIETLNHNFERLCDLFPTDVFVFAGDVNELNYSELLINFGFCQIVDVPTRGQNLLDVFITNRPDLFDCTVAKSILSTDHKALYINCIHDDSIARLMQPRDPAPRHVIKCYNRSPEATVKLLEFFDSYSWAAAELAIETKSISVDNAFNDFISVLQFALDNVVGYNNVTVKSTDPAYMTPAIKILIRKRRKLLQRGQIEKAEHMAGKIGRKIAKVKAGLLRKASTRDTKQLWQLLKRTNNWSKRSHANTADIAMSADSLNSYFAGIATDPTYSADAISAAVRDAESRQSQSRDILSDFHPYSADHIAIVLQHTANTAPGPGGIPAWVYKTLAAQISGIVSRLINYSISQSLAPIAWRCAQITPVPKTNPVTGPSDFRPISVTPILSRVTERLITIMIIFCPASSLNYSVINMHTSLLAPQHVL